MEYILRSTVARNTLHQSVARGGFRLNKMGCNLCLGDVVAQAPPAKASTKAQACLETNPTSRDPEPCAACLSCMMAFLAAGLSARVASVQFIRST